MFDNYFFLTRLVDELKKELIGFEFFKSISQSRNELVTGFFHFEKEKYLIFAFQKLPVIIYLKDQFAFAKKNYASFFDELSGKKIKNIYIDEFERNVKFEFDGYNLVFVIRGNHSNVVLVDSNGVIKKSFKHPQKFENQKFTEFFSSTNIDSSFFNDGNKFNSLFFDNKENSKNYLKILGELIINELKERVTTNNKSYHQNFLDILQEIKTSPLYIYEDGTVSFFQLKHKSISFKTSQNIFQDLADAYFSSLKVEEIDKLKLKLIKKFKKDLETHRKKLSDLDRPENFIDRSDEYRNMANLILINSNEIKKGSSFLTTEFDGVKYKIKLDSALSPFENAEKYFEKAREEKSRIKALKNLTEKEKKEIERITTLISEIENMNDYKKLKSFYDAQVQKEENENLERLFRHFKIAGKYDVYVGKDSKSNDRLTIEFAKNDDLWFHARGVSGSHVILRKPTKKETFPKNVIEIAASIAAYFSKSKNSKLAPVSYTEKKYVVKRKGMPPGTVQLLREKVIMVEPKLPTEEINQEDS